MLTPAEMERAANLVLLMLTVILLVLGLGSSLIFRLVEWLSDHYEAWVMSREARAEARAGTPNRPPDPKPEVVSADTDAVRTGSEARTGSEVVRPEISRRMGDITLIAVLAVQRKQDGPGYRFSANEIAKLVGGERGKVLEQVRAVRGLPSFPQLDEAGRQVAEGK